MRKFKIVRDPFYKEDYLYKKEWVSFKEGLTVLVGCNGTGKTTLQKTISRKLKEKGIAYIHYDNINQHDDYTSDYVLMREHNYAALANKLESSEGENITNSLGIIAQKIGQKIQEIKNSGKEKELWLMFDAIDSGLSINNICDFKNFLKNILQKDLEQDGIKLYMLASANEYELANEEQCYDVSNCEYITFDDYEDYRNFILESSEDKIERLEKMEKIKAELLKRPKLS